MSVSGGVVSVARSTSANIVESTGSSVCCIATREVTPPIGVNAFERGAQVPPLQPPFSHRHIEFGLPCFRNAPCLRGLNALKGSEPLHCVNAMHITASVLINDNESGLDADFERWPEKPSPEKPHGAGRECLPRRGRRRRVVGRSSERCHARFGCHNRRLRQPISSIRAPSRSG
jgi:hypothetical protein